MRALPAELRETMDLVDAALARHGVPWSIDAAHAVLLAALRDQVRPELFDALHEQSLHAPLIAALRDELRPDGLAQILRRAAVGVQEGQQVGHGDLMARPRGTTGEAGR